MAVTYDQIAQRAFEIWEREGRPQGRDQEHWYQAELELRKQPIKAPGPKESPKPSPELSQMPKKPKGKSPAEAPVPVRKAKASQPQSRP